MKYTLNPILEYPVYKATALGSKGPLVDHTYDNWVFQHPSFIDRYPGKNKQLELNCTVD